jgi:predicted AAA+ superfamily ATPase
VGIVGARQVGKTTLARKYGEICGQKVTYFDLEDPGDLSRLGDPMLALKDLEGLAIIDEIQKAPGLFSILRVLVDRQGIPCRFLVLGSASPHLLRQSAETLAGRIYYHQLNGFSIGEVGPGHLKTLWLRGGFPRAFLAKNHRQSHEWRRQYIQTFLERDLPQLGVTTGAATMRRFWTMLAHYHGQVWNASEFARSFGVADTTIRQYLDRLASALVIDVLQPWHENISKRQVKSPKVYIADTGLLHSLLNQVTLEDMESHPKLGASWEGFVIGQVTRQLEAAPEECFFWRTHAGAELDLLVVRGRTRIGFEIKRTVSPKITPSMRHALSDLKLSRLDVIHAGDHTYMMAENIRAVPISRILSDIDPLD